MIPALLSVFSLLLPAVQPDQTALPDLLEGVELLPQLGIPGHVAVYGDHAFAVLTTERRPEAIAAAAIYGEGRVFAIAHGAYLGFGQPQQAQLYANALRWCAQDEVVPKIAVLGANHRVQAGLKQAGFEAVAGVTADQLGDYQLAVWDDGAIYPPAAYQAIRRWVHAGGGLVTATCPWGWEQIYSRRGLSLLEHLPQNQVLADMGMVFANGYAERRHPQGFAVAASRPDQAHLRPILDQLEKTGSSTRLDLVERALGAVPARATAFWARLDALLARARASGEIHAPTPSRPLARTDSLSRLAIHDWYRRYRPKHDASFDEEDILKNPAPGALEFPGVSPGPRGVSLRPIHLDPQEVGWISAGLYLQPGTELQLGVSNGLLHDWTLRIGSHSDQLWHKDSWRRLPQVQVSFSGLSDGMGYSSPFGGLIYFEAGAEAQAVEAFIYLPIPVLDNFGDPNFTKWEAHPNGFLNPWVDLHGEHIILTLPREGVESAQELKAAIQYWDQVMVSHCRLAGTPLPLRRERVVADVQISAGYMHAGYPIMVGLDVAVPRGDRPAVLLDVEELREKGNWGMFHELGHNRQKPEWTFAGTGEVTCNLFTLYTMESMVGIEPWKHPWLEAQKDKARRYLAGEGRFEQWQSDPGLALVMYAQIQREFGWKPFQEVFAAYAALPTAQKPHSEDDKRDQWLMRMSNATGRDLGPFFKLWKVPVSGRALAAIADLPDWSAPPI